MSNDLRDEQGGALIVALLMMSIMMLLGVAMMASAQDSVVRTVWDRSSSQSFHAAEAGFDQVMFMARSSNLAAGSTINGKTRDAEYKVTVSGMTTGGAGEFLFDIKATGAAPSFANPKAKRAIRSRIAALSPYSMFLASVSAGDTIQGNATINGAFYTRDLFSLTGTGASAGKFTGGPLFVKDLAGTVSPTGDLNLQGNAQVGTAADPIYLFLDGQITGNAANAFSKGTYSDVPDLNFPMITISDIVNKYRPTATEVIDSDLTKVGTTNLSLNRTTVPAGGYTSPGGHLSFTWLNGARTQALLTVNGTVYVDGDVQIGQTTGVAVTTYFQGKGTIVAYGNVKIESSFLPKTSFPNPDVIGFITADSAEVEGKPGDIVYAVMYSSSELEFEGKVEYHGAALTQKMEFDNNPSLILDPSVATNLPPGMPSPEAQVSVSGWKEVKP